MTSTTSLIPAGQSSEPSLLKTDVLGRIQRTREQRERILDEYERSGVSGAKFAALCGVKYQTFANWLQCRKRQRSARPKRPPGRKTRPITEARVQPTESLPQTGLLLQFPGGAAVRISTQQHIDLAAALVRALEKPC